MLVQFGNNWIQKIPLSSEFFSSNYFQIGQHVVLLHILISIHSLQTRAPMLSMYIRTLSLKFTEIVC